MAGPAGGWDCKVKAQNCQNERLGTQFRKSESCGVAGPAKTRMSKVRVAGTAKTRNSEARNCQNEHLGAQFRKSESWGMVGPAKSRTLKVLVA